MRIFTAAAGVAASIVAMSFAGSAAAHVTANPDEAAADSWFRTALRVEHGCEGSPTVAVRVKLPDRVTFVSPRMKPGWDIEIVRRDLDTPLETEYGEVTEVVDEVVWRGGPLPDAYFDEFGLSMKLPDEPGGTLYLPTVQECEEGVHRWIEIPDDFEDWGDFEEPAPFIRLIEGTEEH